MAEAGVFERRTRGEAGVVYAGSVALCALGWASALWPVIPALICAGLVAVGAGVALARRAARVRIARAVGEQLVWEQEAPGDDEVSDLFTAPGWPVVDAERDAA